VSANVPSKSKITARYVIGYVSRSLGTSKRMCAPFDATLCLALVNPYKGLS
jgi:hypothetical protein